jgi:hypothetical protein
MFWPLMAIIRRHSQHYEGIPLNMLLLTIGCLHCYHSIIEGLIIVTEIKTK